MSRNTSPRLKVITESDDELIDQFEYNWPQLDKYAHPVDVSAGGTLPDNELYDGCILAEPPSVSSKLWMSRKNNAGVNVKNYITYPWSIGVVSDTYNQTGYTGAQGWAAGLLSGTNSIDCVNSSLSDLEPSGLKRLIAPETGLYSCCMSTHIVGDGNSRAYLAVWNHEGGDIPQSEMVGPVGSTATIKIFNTRQYFLRKGTMLGWSMTIFGAAAIFSNRAWVTLLNTINEDI